MKEKSLPLNLAFNLKRPEAFDADVQIRVRKFFNFKLCMNV